MPNFKSLYINKMCSIISKTKVFDIIEHILANQNLHMQNQLECIYLSKLFSIFLKVSVRVIFKLFNIKKFGKKKTLCEF